MELFASSDRLYIYTDDQRAHCIEYTGDQRAHRIEYTGDQRAHRIEYTGDQRAHRIKYQYYNEMFTLAKKVNSVI